MPGAVSPEINHPTSPSTTHRRESLKILSRNINRVALGNLVFPTWYYSPYPDSIIHDQDTNTITVKIESGNNITASRHDGKYDSNHASGPTSGSNGITKHSDMHGSHNIIPNERALLDMLHVCPYCFRYTPSTSDFAGHMALHIKTESEYYTTTSRTKRNSMQRRMDTSDSEDEVDNTPKPVPDSAVKVYSHEGYTVWDIDGEVEKLYCQNLSLFGKLFLEQKSVFFDTAGFHYFVLTYSPPAEDTPKPRQRASRDIQGSPTSSRKRKSNSFNFDPSTVQPTLDQPCFPLRHQVLGFFSKENLSWDSNNLACILVFPPYQHRNLGQLLMSVSYKLSGWEWEDSIIGGPEKPLSSMGRKSYLRFWSERIARFIMGQSQDAEGLKIFEEGIMEEAEEGQIMTGKKRKRKHGKGLLRDEFTIKQLGDRTGMLGEDVVAALTEMGVCEIIPPKRKKNVSTVTSKESQNDHIISVTVNRSKILDWAKKNGVDLVSSIKEEGFLGEWALSEEGSEENESVEVDGGEDELESD